MLALQWVENIQAMEGEIEKDGVEVSPGVGMITLPGGAVLVAKTGEGESSKDRLTRVARCSLRDGPHPVPARGPGPHPAGCVQGREGHLQDAGPTGLCCQLGQTADHQTEDCLAWHCSNHHHHGAAATKQDLDPSFSVLFSFC